MVQTDVRSDIDEMSKTNRFRDNLFSLHEDKLISSSTYLLEYIIRNLVSG